jgi:MoaA/NifB/PqqE/SkfB family radical SAM enzyme
MVARLSETWFRRPASPTRVVLDVTRRCNLRCDICQTWRHHGEGELSVSEIASILRELPHLCWLDVTGGEPFLRNDAKELFAAVAETTPKLVVLHFPTNGSFTRRAVEVSAELVARRPEIELIVTVSIDGPPEVHDRLRGQRGSFARAIDTFAALREMPAVSVFVGTTLTPANEPHLAALEAELRRRFPDFSAREWHFNRLQLSEHFFGNSHLARAPRSQRSSIENHLRRRGLPKGFVDWMELGFLINAEFVDRGEPANIPCQSLRSTAFISPEGELYPCHVWQRPLGSLREHSFATLWHSPEVLTARAEVERLACGGCFTPCEAYPALAGSPLRASVETLRRGLRILRA